MIVAPEVIELTGATPASDIWSMFLGFSLLVGVLVVL
jgi:hypothetical protein